MTGMPDSTSISEAFHRLIVLQDRKRLPARFFMALSGTRLGRLS